MKLTLTDLAKLHGDAPHDKWGWSSHVLVGRALRTNGTAYRWGPRSASGLTVMRPDGRPARRDKLNAATL